ncbi:MAG TPA: ligase-associated DNA damage response exonuclease [Bryobacteraceae bacterium]|nr:ligase-associated DNA damage response exonuclease [Bryobacteraceae bacterium]
MPLLELRESGLYCAAGDFYVDPWAPVSRAVITHAHKEHAVAGCSAYLTAISGEALLRDLIGADLSVQPVPYGETLTLGSARVSLHPAGHILGSAQVRIEDQGEVWVVSGDYKLDPDPTCAPFEPVRCHTFLTEATFGLPIFRWPENTIEAINGWWRSNQEAGKTSLLFVHEAGMAQRLLAQIDAANGPIHAYDAVERITTIYRRQGVAMPPALALAEPERTLILAALSQHGSPWARSFSNASTAMVSGWMRIRGPRRRRSLDRGFVLSDHADWPALLRAIDQTGAERVYVTHGFRAPLVHWLQEHGKDAAAWSAPFEEAEA